MSTGPARSVGRRLTGENLPVRVLHVLPHRGGGAETYIELLERIPGSVHERFYLSRGRTPASGVASIPGRWRRLPARLRAAQLAHVHGDVASVLALPVLRVRPAILSTHGLHMLRRLDGPRRAVFARALAGAVHASRTVVCTSASELSEVSAVAAGRDRDKLQVIHNGIDPPAAVDGGRRAALRRELGAGPETIIGLFVGQLEPRKAPLLAARAAIRANAVDERFVLAVAGDGPQAAALEALRGEAASRRARTNTPPTALLRWRSAARR
jgi:glycosyltransferase involved in cell wall biosynthesis